MGPPALLNSPNLSLHAATLATEACKAKADELGVPMNIAIVDSSLYLLSFARMPGAKLTSVDVAYCKAFTAAGHRNGTHTYKEKVWPGGAMYGIDKTNGGKFLVIGGGLPVAVEGVTVGGIGCSTGTPDQDQQVAQAGVDAIMEYIRKEGPKARL